MKGAPLLVGILLIANAQAQQPDQPAPRGVIYGTVVDQQGQPAKGINLMASPLGVPLGAVLPHTRTDQAGKYRFEKIPWWGRYTVFAQDEEAGYSMFSMTGADRAAEVTLSPQHPEAEFDFRLPPKAVFLHIRLTNRRTGAVIPGVAVKVTSQDPDRLIFSGSFSSDRVILLPPDKDLILHITSPGFLEWKESAGRGKPTRMASGSVLKLDVQLEPAN